MVFYHQVLRAFCNNNGEEDLFLLVFHQNTFTKDFFTSQDEFLETNTFHKYSIWKYIDDDFKTDDVFEFIMEYPETGKFGRWTQTKNPLEAVDEENVNVVDKGSTWETDMPFNGLHYSNRYECFMDGTNLVTQHGGNTWYFTIGLRMEWSGNILPNYKSQVLIEIHQVYLWLKITNLNLLKRIFPQISCQHYMNIFRFNGHILCFISLFAS